MGYLNKWKIEDGPSPRESERLWQYYQANGGLFFREFNTTKYLEGRTRSIDAIRFPNLESGFYKAQGNYLQIKEIIQEQPVEVIEVHKWGFYALGQLIGKAEILEKYWSPKDVSKVLIMSNLTSFHPASKPDPPTEEIFKKHNISIHVPKL